MVLTWVNQPWRIGPESTGNKLHQNTINSRSSSYQYLDLFDIQQRKSIDQSNITRWALGAVTKVHCRPYDMCTGLSGIVCLFFCICCSILEDCFRSIFQFHTHTHRDKHYIQNKVWTMLIVITVWYKTFKCEQILAQTVPRLRTIHVWSILQDDLAVVWIQWSVLWYIPMGMLSVETQYDWLSQFQRYCTGAVIQLRLILADKPCKSPWLTVYIYIYIYI